MIFSSAGNPGRTFYANEIGNDDGLAAR